MREERSIQMGLPTLGFANREEGCSVEVILTHSEAITHEYSGKRTDVERAISGSLS